MRGCQRFLVQIVLVPKAASLEYEFRKQSLRHWNLDITIELLGITNYFLYPSHSKIDEKEPQYSEQILPVTPIKISIKRTIDLGNILDRICPLRTLEMAFKSTKISKFSGGACPQTPLVVCPFTARLIHR